MRVILKYDINHTFIELEIKIWFNEHINFKIKAGDL